MNPRFQLIDDEEILRIQGAEYLLDGIMSVGSFVLVPEGCAHSTDGPAACEVQTLRLGVASQKASAAGPVVRQR